MTATPCWQPRQRFCAPVRQASTDKIIGTRHIGQHPGHTTWQAPRPHLAERLQAVLGLSDGLPNRAAGAAGPALEGVCSNAQHVVARPPGAGRLPGRLSAAKERQSIAADAQASQKRDCVLLVRPISRQESTRRLAGGWPGRDGRAAHSCLPGWRHEAQPCARSTGRACGHPMGRPLISKGGQHTSNSTDRRGHTWHASFQH